MRKLSVCCLAALHRALRHPRLAVPLGTAVHLCLIGLLVALIAATTPNPILALPMASHRHGFTCADKCTSNQKFTWEASGSASGIRWADLNSTSEIMGTQCCTCLQEQMSANVAGLFSGSKDSDTVARSSKEVTQCKPSALTCTSFVAAATCNINCCMTQEGTTAGADSSPPTTTMPLALNQRVRRQTCLHLPTEICALSNPIWKVPQLAYQETRNALRKIVLSQLPIVEAMSLQSSERSKWIRRSGPRPC
jgi:hypothetical protein